MDLLSNKYYRQALEFIASGKLADLPLGRNVIDGDNLFVNVIEIDLKTPGQAPLEAHDAYIDIQVPISGPECYGVTLRKDCGPVSKPYNPEKDVMFFEGVASDFVTAQPGGLIVFTPDMAHAPGIGEGKLRKAIFKVKICAE